MRGCEQPHPGYGFARDPGGAGADPRKAGGRRGPSSIHPGTFRGAGPRV